MTTTVVIDGYFSEGCTLFIYSWDTLIKQRPLATQSYLITSSIFHMEFRQGLAAWPHILIQFLLNKQFESSPSLIIPKEYTQRALSGCTNKPPLVQKDNIAPSSIIHINFSEVLSFIVQYLNKFYLNKLFYLKQKFSSISQSLRGLSLLHYTFSLTVFIMRALQNR